MGYTFSDNLKRIRIKKGLTQDELAKIIFVSRTTITSWESAIRYPSLDRLYDLAQALDVSVNDLIQ